MIQKVKVWNDHRFFCVAKRSSIFELYALEY